MPGWIPSGRATCHVCGQQSLVQVLVRSIPALWMFWCPECDSGHCPSCGRHTPTNGRHGFDAYCTECGASLALDARHTSTT